MHFYTQQLEMVWSNIDFTYRQFNLCRKQGYYRLGNDSTERCRWKKKLIDIGISSYSKLQCRIGIGYEIIVSSNLKFKLQELWG